ncbi:DUF4142 domain-containing protein [Pontibacter sp. HSC-14F20]|uniref:DUF4142 domain-containing protein n=1 Tax=Pontibacter sp. HSC-14F20 TaxID=2864136 RepID=UPI001C73BB23|nr:DUF4142 domain-containing protein [Pontibacter sp. HSC-14F20]MBX0332907.1 DUF4142 domain-containing protein [Pontibacter sp. HSC-14F20]
MKRAKDLRWGVLLLFMSLAFLAACDDDDDDNIDGPRLTSQEFVQRAAASDMFEIQTGNMALQKSTMQEVRDFAQEIVTDHTASSQELMTLAQQKNLQVPTTLPQEKQAIVTRLDGKTDTPFDKDFADVQEDAHEEAVELYEQAVEDLEDTELRAFAQKILPKLRMHLEHARELDDMTDAL